MSTELKALVSDMHRDGLTDMEMEERCGVNRKRIGAIRRELGLKSNYVRFNIIDLGDGLAECTKCGTHLPKKDLPWGRVTKYPYQLSYCRDCLTRAAVDNSKKTIAQYLNHRQRALKARSVDKGAPFNLPPGHLLRRYESQGGRCFYTDREMKVYFGTDTSGYRPDALTVDKIIPEQGYTVGNVVICQFKANKIKLDCSLDEMAEWLPSWHARVIQLWNEEGIPTTVVPGWETE